MSSILRRQIIRKCGGMDIPLIGFAPVDRWDDPPFEPWVPEEFRPASVFPGAKTVIVIGFPVSLPIVDTAPSIWYHELYHTVNELLDSCGYRLATFLTEKGYPSVWVPRDGYGSIEGTQRETSRVLLPPARRILCRHGKLRAQQRPPDPPVWPQSQICLHHFHGRNSRRPDHGRPAVYQMPALRHGLPGLCSTRR